MLQTKEQADSSLKSHCPFSSDAISWRNGSILKWETISPAFNYRYYKKSTSKASSQALWVLLFLKLD